MSNRATWGAADVVDEYARAGDLQESEKTILRSLEPQWEHMRMLDIGVGGGRTTLHFAPRVKEYVGIDYSAAMIGACKKRFSAEDWRAHASFLVVDARGMKPFANDSFDFVLFSFNGIDYIPPRDRRRVFNEVRRVGKSRALFFFSTHNLSSIEPAAGGTDRRSEAIIDDGVHEGRLRTVYVRPGAQLARLRRYFTNVAVFSAASGSLLDREADLERSKDPWLYYLCTIDKQRRDTQSWR